MNFQSMIKDTRKISIIAMLIIFLALIRCIAEPFRLQYYAAKMLTFNDMKPFLMGSVITSLALLIMTFLSMLGRYKIVIATCIVTLAVLFVIKGLYMIS